MSLLIGFYYVTVAIMYFFKALFGIGSLWYIVNGIVNAANDPFTSVNNLPFGKKELGV